MAEQIDANNARMTEQIETSKAREAELQQALAAQQELAESRLAMLKKVEGETADREPAEATDEPIVQAAMLVNSIGIELKLIPAGTFTMGQAGGDEDEIPHEVTLTKPFYLGVYEVTNAQWSRLMPSVPSDWKDADRPVEQVSWVDANEFCRRLSELPQERQAGRVYRLPTEAEWEYACRAGTTTQWSFGDDESRAGDYAWFDGNSDGQTHPVGTKKPNAWGLFDMHGNVYEWCSEGSSEGSSRVFRGGCWYYSAGDCRSANRYGNVPSDRRGDLGFRLALSPSEAEQEPTGAAASVSPPEVQSPQDLAPAGLSPADARALQEQKAQALGLELEITNSIGMTLVAIPPGTFIMGSAEDGLVTHQVTLSQPFYLGIHEVTNGQWLSVMGSVPSRWKDGNRPVETVDWHDVNEFCRRLSSLPKEEKEGRVYRLPTESEWEYACRAGTTTSYSYGDEEGQLGDYAWFANNSGNVVLDAKKLLLASKDKRSNDDRLERYQCRTHPVGRKRPNSWGLFDMHGNVWEWCSDWYGDYPMVAVTDPQGPVQGSVRIRRGGPWNDPAECCRSAYRDFRGPTHTSHSLGFRLALSPSGAEQEPPEAEAAAGN
jgi:formylglycine-generating enzyme required for sulfatase activity